MPAFTIIKNSAQVRIVKKYDKYVGEGDERELYTALQQIENELEIGESVIAGAYPPNLYKILDGEAVERTESDWVYVNPKPRPPENIVNDLAADLKTSGMATTSTLPPPQIWTKSDAKSAIDQAAGRARYRMASDGVFVDEEYTQTELAVQQWRVEGSPAELVPDEILCWAEAKNWTVEQAAQDIEYNAMGFKYLIALIRRHRLTGKCAVDAAESDFAAVAQPFIDQLNAL